MTAWKSQLWRGMTYSDNVKMQRYDMIRLHMTYSWMVGGSNRPVLQLLGFRFGIACQMSLKL
jgi:hypothetical protein